jgi:hypothetical protein
VRVVTADEIAEQSAAEISLQAEIEAGRSTGCVTPATGGVVHLVETDEQGNAIEITVDVTADPDAEV